MLVQRSPASSRGFGFVPVALAPGVVPGQGDALNDRDQRKQRDAQERRNDGIAKGQVGAERMLLIREQDAQAIDRADIFAKERANDGIGCGDAQARKERRQRVWQTHAPEDDQFARAKSAIELDEFGVGGAQPISHRNRDGEEADEGNDNNLGQEAKAKRKNQQWGNGDNRDGLRGYQQWINRPAQERRKVDDGCRQHAKSQRGGQPHQRFIKRRADMRGEGGAAGDAGRDDAQRRRQDQWVDVARLDIQLPARQQQREQQHGRPHAGARATNGSQQLHSATS